MIMIDVNNDKIVINLSFNILQNK